MNKKANTTAAAQNIGEAVKYRDITTVLQSQNFIDAVKNYITHHDSSSRLAYVRPKAHELEFIKAIRGFLITSLGKNLFPGIGGIRIDRIRYEAFKHLHIDDGVELAPIHNRAPVVVVPAPAVCAGDSYVKDSNTLRHYGFLVDAIKDSATLPEKGNFMPTAGTTLTYSDLESASLRAWDLCGVTNIKGTYFSMLVTTIKNMERTKEEQRVCREAQQQNARSDKVKPVEGFLDHNERCNFLYSRGFIINKNLGIVELPTKQEFENSNANSMLTYEELGAVIEKTRTILKHGATFIKITQEVWIGVMSAEAGAKKKAEAALASTNQRLERREYLCRIAARFIARSTIVAGDITGVIDSMALWDYMAKPQDLNNRTLEVATRCHQTLQNPALRWASSKLAGFVNFHDSFDRVYRDVLRGDYTVGHSTLMQFFASSAAIDGKVRMVHGARNGHELTHRMVQWYEAISNLQTDSPVAVAISNSAHIAFAVMVTRQIIEDLLALQSDVKFFFSVYGSDVKPETFMRTRELGDILHTGDHSDEFKKSMGTRFNRQFSLADSMSQDSGDLFDGPRGMRVALGLIDAFISTGRADFNSLYRICATAAYELETVRSLIVGALMEHSSGDTASKMQEVYAAMANVNSIDFPGIHNKKTDSVYLKEEPSADQSYCSGYITSVNRRVGSSNPAIYFPNHYEEVAKRLVG